MKETWSEAFEHVENNLKGIKERGWYPLTNKMLSLHPLILATMAETMIQTEIQQHTFPKHVQDNLLQSIYSLDMNNINLGIQSKKQSSISISKEELLIGLPPVPNCIIEECNREKTKEHSNILKAEGKIVYNQVLSIMKK